MKEKMMSSEFYLKGFERGKEKILVEVEKMIDKLQADGYDEDGLQLLKSKLKEQLKT